MKILHIIDNLGLGGAQTLVRDIFEYQKENKDIYLFSLREKKIKIMVEHENTFDFCGAKKYSFSPLKKIREIIIKEKIDVLHCHLFRSNIFGFILKKIWFPNIKIVIHEHGEIFQSNIFYNLFIKISKKYIDKIIAVSGVTKKEIISFLPKLEKKTEVLYNFINFSRLHKNNIKWDIKEERLKLGITKNNFVLGFAGRLVKEKGWREFIEASKTLIKNNKDFKFLIAGDGKDRKNIINSIKKNNLEKNIIFLGYVSDMVWFYSVLDCFVTSSYWESMGLTILESQALGIPVVSSDVVALNEIITNENNGLLFKVKDSSSLSEKVKLVYEDDSLRNRLIKNGLETVKDYSIEKYLEKLSKIYE